MIDGHTLRDLDCKVTYRLANIDAPETGDRAGCSTERIKGERAKTEAERILAAAAVVEARPVGKIDRYGRTVAWVLVDGRDLGVLLIAGGHARPWSGARAVWCGANGVLVQMASERSVEWTCRQCGARSTPALAASPPPGAAAAGQLVPTAIRPAQDQTQTSNESGRP